MTPTSARPSSKGREDRARPLRVAAVSFEFGEFCVPLANALSGCCDVLLALPQDQARPYGHRLETRVQLHEFSKPRLRQVGRQARMIQDLDRAVGAFAPDVVHLQQGHLWLNVALGLLHWKPLVVTVHDPSPHVGDRDSARTPHRIMALPFARADRLIVHTRAVADQLVTEHRIDRTKVTVVPLLGAAVDDGGDDGRDRGERPPTVLFFGRRWPYKGLVHLIDAVPTVAAAVPDVRVVVAGGGEPWTTYAGRPTDPGRFEVHDRFVTEAERDALFRDADVVVVPYVEATQSGVVELARRHGRAVVATSVGGLVEQIDHDETGLLVPPADPDALAEALAALLTDDERRARLGAAGRRRQEQSAGATAVSARTVAVYEQARSEVGGAS